MATFLEKNLAALEKTSPEAAQAIRNVPPEEMQRFEWVEAKRAHVPTLIYHPPEGKPRYLASQYDPLVEAKRWVESNRLEKQTNLIYFGIGLGYHILNHLSRYKGFSRHVLLVEKSPALCRAALSATDLSPLLSAPCFRMYIAPEVEEFERLLEKELRTDFMLHNFRFFWNEASKSLNEDYYKELSSEFNEIVARDLVNIRTMVGQRARNPINVLANLAAFWLGLKPRDMDKRFEGLPGFVVAAGPSLDKNVRELKRLNGRGVIVAVDTAQNTLKEAGIQPDFVVTADPTPLNFSHFDKVDSLGSAILAFHPEAYNEIIQKYAAHPHFLALQDLECKFLNYLEPAEEKAHVVLRGMHVGQIAYNLAWHMGCNPIVLLGLDLAFSRDGGTTHAKSAAVSRSITAPDAEGKSSIDSKEGKIGTERGRVVWVDGVDGQKVPTSMSFQAYIQDFEQAIKMTEAEVIDATEGGALIRNAKLARLADVVDSLGDSDCRSILDELRRPRPVKNPDPALEKLTTAQDLLVKSKKHLWEALEQIRKWPELIDGGQVTQQIANQEWETLNNTWLKAVSDPLFDQILGQAVTYLYYLRQRAADLPDPSPEAFLRLMNEKYTYILTELITTVDQFVDVFGIVIEQFQRMKQLIQSSAGTKEELS